MEALIFIVVLFIIVVYFISKSSKSFSYGKKRFYKNKWNNQYNKQSKIERNLEYMYDGKIRVKRIMN